METLTRTVNTPVAPLENGWKGHQRFLFRVAFIFFVIMSVPWSWEWYRNFFTIDWTSLHYRDLYDIARFQPAFIKGSNRVLYGYAEWFIILGVAIIGAAIWSLLDKRKEYNILYYWLRVIVRYRAGIGIIGFGFTKLLPVQMPYPSIGLLNTNFGDFTPQKIYWLSVGIVPWYQIFAGVIEITAGALLFFRKTTLLGAILLFGALGDIVYVNFAFDGGVHVYSSYFVLFAAFLILYDVPKLYNLLILERLTTPVNIYPSFSQSWLKYTRTGLKSLTIIVFLGVLFYVQLINFLYDPYKQPAMSGVKKLRGLYHVSEFRINNKVIPESPLDSMRWQDVSFEKWSSLTYKVNRPVKLDLSNGGGSPMRDINRTFELTGVAGGRRVFYYEADTVNKVLYLQDKNLAERRRNRGGVAKNDKPVVTDNWIPEEARKNIGDETYKIDPRALSARRIRGIAKEKALETKRNRMVLKYSTNDGKTVILRGTDENRDSIYVVLNRIDRKYALSESNLEAGKY
ncbi:hypothetical protein [Arcticibacter tournemirensis]